jgi:hypothetical protein
MPTSTPKPNSVPPPQLGQVIYDWLENKLDSLANWVDNHRRGMLLVAYLLTVLGGALLLFRWQIDAVLRQMRPPGVEGGGGLSFPIAPGDLQRVLGPSGSWEGHNNSLVTVLHPSYLLTSLLWLGICFIVCYAGVLLVCYAVARKLDRTIRPPSMENLCVARGQLLVVGPALVLLLVIVDLLEDVVLFAANTSTGWNWTHAVGPWLSLIKLVLVGMAVLPLVVTAATVLAGHEKLRAALIASRGVSVVVGAAAVLLLVLPLGSEQADDVVRAWGGPNAIAAVAFTLIAAAVVLCAVRQLTAGVPENLEPDTAGRPNGRTVVNPNPDANLHPPPGSAVTPKEEERKNQPDTRLQWLAVWLLAVGVVLYLLGLGWGLLVAAGMLAAILFVSWLIRGEALPVREDATRATDPVLGQRLARLLGAGVCVMVFWVMARATAFDLFVRATWPPVGWTVIVATAMAVLAVAGAAILLFSRKPPEVMGTEEMEEMRGHASSIARVWGIAAKVVRWWWVWLTVFATLALWITLWRWAGVTGSMLVGSVAVVMAAVAAGVGVVSLLVVCVRMSRFTWSRLPDALRVLNLKRFPAIAFVLVWALLVAVIDNGGFHDVRRDKLPVPLGPAPSLEQAYDAWLAAGPAPTGTTGAAAPRPLVLVAAAGGGMRAAVWTALVMECVFGPGPVDGGGACAHQGSFDVDAAARAVRSDRLPVFLASGASGGSLGFAAWSARRVDLAAGQTRVPTTIDDLLPRDYVAPDLARLLSGDTLHLLLAHKPERIADRAAILEQSLEQSWGNPGEGLSRGMRAAWQTANGSRGQWRIPVLALNGAQVEDGCRFVSSPVDFLVSRSPEVAEHSAPTGGDDLPSDPACGLEDSTDQGGVVDALSRSTELIDYLCDEEDVHLSTAALLSGRFPLILPTARVSAEDCVRDTPGLMSPGSVSYVTDGGYLDNSGASTALQAWRALAPLAAARERAGGPCVIPLFLQIDNSVRSGSGEDVTQERPLELLAPAQALLTGLAARQSLESSEARRAFASVRSVDGRAVTVPGVDDARSSWFRIAPDPQPGLEPPLGWTLSASTIADMREQLGSETNQKTIQRLRALLGGGLSCGPMP